MLTSIDGKTYTELPHKNEYDRWMRNIKATDYQRVEDELNRIIDEKVAAGEPVTTGWIVPTILDGTPFIALYEACNKCETHTGLFLGLIVFDIMMHRPEQWYFGRFTYNGKEISSMTYFLEGKE